MHFATEYETKFASWMVAAPMALVVSFLLAAMMERLVFNDFIAPEESDPVNLDDIVYVPEPIETIKLVPPLPKPVMNEIPDELPSDVDDQEKSFTYEQTSIDVNVDTKDNFRISFSGVPIAQYLVQPRYPSRAIQRGIEGYVDVKFDVDKIGMTKNIRVIKAQPENIFNKAALAAVSRWRYQPKIEDGEAKYFSGMTKRITFQMEN